MLQFNINAQWRKTMAGNAYKHILKLSDFCDYIFILN